MNDFVKLQMLAEEHELVGCKIILTTGYKFYDLSVPKGTQLCIQAVLPWPSNGVRTFQCSSSNCSYDGRRFLEKKTNEVGIYQKVFRFLTPLEELAYAAD